MPNPIVFDECFDLFASLSANDDQLDFPHMYASGRAGWANRRLDGPRKDLSALFDLVVSHVYAPKQIAHRNDFQMLATTLGNDPFVGRILTGRVGRRLEGWRHHPSADPPGQNRTPRYVFQASAALRRKILNWPRPAISFHWPG